MKYFALPPPIFLDTIIISPMPRRTTSVIGTLYHSIMPNTVRTIIDDCIRLGSD